jgi:glycosyltransferase involved in cell wall biosynthesis
MISVVIPSLNSEGCLKTTLDSINCQRAIAIEVILADGGSVDGCVKLFENYPFQNHVKAFVVQNKNERNISETLYKSFNSAAGDFIYQICAGDILVWDQWLSYADSFLAKNPGIDAVWARTFLKSVDDMPLKIFPPLSFRNVPQGNEFLYFWHKYDISPPDNTIVVKKTLLLTYFCRSDWKGNVFDAEIPHANFNFMFLIEGHFVKFEDRIVHQCVVDTKSRTAKNFCKIFIAHSKLKQLKQRYILKTIATGKFLVKGKITKINIDNRLKLFKGLCISVLPIYRLFQSSIPELVGFVKNKLLGKVSYWH